MKIPELLAPAGSFEKAKTAFKYGADAVYCGTGKLSLRSRSEVDDNDLEKTIEYAHNIGKKVYAALNIYAFDESYDDIETQIKMLSKMKVDGVIASDGGVIAKIKEIDPNLSINISTQANVVSWHSAKFWYDNGAKRIILGREVSKDQIEEIIKNKPQDLEIEIFIHGALCWAYSGRCFLSNYLSNRSANLGDCSQSCRWAYNMYIEEKNNPGQMMPVETDENGTYILSSKDLCLVEELPQIIDMGIDSLKIEGRLKTEYYLASVVKAYRAAIDDYIKNPKEYDYKKYMVELDKITTRSLTKFYFNDRNNQDIGEYEGKQYNPNFEFGGKVLKVEDNFAIVEIKNKLSVGDTIEILIPNTIDVENFKIEELKETDTNENIDTINPGKIGQTVKIKIPFEVEEGIILRRKK